MFKKFAFLALGLFLLNGCHDGARRPWGSEWGKEAVEAPENLVAYPEYLHGQPDTDAIKTVAVLLPLSGDGSDVGVGIQHAIEIAFFQKQPKNIMVAFNDLSGSQEDKYRTIDSVISHKPDLIIGPLFEKDVELLRRMKPYDIPAITFTSAKAPLGNGIFTMALLPNQAIEAIVKQMQSEGKERLLILAPDNDTGWMLANNALNSAEIYNINVAGLYFYPEFDGAEIPKLAEKVSFHEARVKNLIRAKEILSEVLINQKLAFSEKQSLKSQLEELNKRDSLGNFPYDAVLMLGNAADSKTMASFLRYYDVNAAKVSFYGSAMWDAEPVYRDMALAGGEFAGLALISESFSNVYFDIEGTRPNRLNTIGYDAALIAMRALEGDKPVGAHLLNSSGYKGADGIVRLRHNGENERALNIMQLNGIRQPHIKQAAEPNFSKSLYRTTCCDLGRPDEKDLEAEVYKPTDYIKLPWHLLDKYKAGPTAPRYEDNVENTGQVGEYVDVAYEEPETAENYMKPRKLEPVNREQINEVIMRKN